MNMIRESDTIDPFKTLQSFITSIQIIGDLELRGISGVGYSAAEMTHAFDESVIVNLSINGLNEQEFQEKLYIDKIAIIGLVRQKINLEISPLNKYRIYQDSVEIISYIISLAQRQRRTIKITNEGDVKLVRSTVFRKLENKHLTRIHDFLVIKVLKEISDQLSQELNFYRDTHLQGRPQLTSPSNSDSEDFKMHSEPEQRDPINAFYRTEVEKDIRIRSLEPDNIESLNLKTEPNYIIPLGIIDKFFKYGKDKLFKTIAISDFINCFDINNKPLIVPQYPRGKQLLMVYALTHIAAINAKIALSNFGIKNYYQMKHRYIPKNRHRSVMYEIDRILTEVAIHVDVK